MKHFISAAFALVAITLVTHSASAKSKELRTDGAPGSEYAHFSDMNGQLQLGAQFGALLPSTGKGNSFLLGADADYRPYDLFGLRFTYHQGVQSPRGSVFALTPLIHTQISNLLPYAYFGPGVAITNNRGGDKLKFDISFGVGADVQLVEHFGLGMLYMYNSLIDSPDFHEIGARLSYIF